jgi:antirestriction protein ArdC
MNVPVAGWHSNQPATAARRCCHFNIVGQAKAVELTATFLCAETAFSNDVRPDHAQYTESYIKLQKSSDKAVFAAAAAASKVADLIAMPI